MKILKNNAHLNITCSTTSVDHNIRK